MSNNNKLIIGIHSNSLRDAVTNDKGVVDVLLECAELKECFAIATPATDPSVLSRLNPEIVRISYEDRDHGAFVAKYKTQIGESRTLFHDSIPPSMITHVYGYKEDSKEFIETKGAFHDLLAFEAISRWRARNKL